MARSKISNTSVDAVSDNGSILWSMVHGEQLEFPVILDFITIATTSYAYEAVVVEALNLGDGEPPQLPRPSGVQTVLTVRLANWRGVWEALGAYDQEDFVLYNSIYYKLTAGADYVSATTPDLDSNWVVFRANTAYIQFPATLTDTWTVKASANLAVYGFFELRVTDTDNTIFVKTWKPLRGLVEILYSPTAAVADV